MVGLNEGRDSMKSNTESLKRRGTQAGHCRPWRGDLVNYSERDCGSRSERRLHILALPRGVNVYVKGDPPSHNIALSFTPATGASLARARALRSLPLVKISPFPPWPFPPTSHRADRLGRTNNIRLPSRISQSGEDRRTEARFSIRSETKVRPIHSWGTRFW